MEDQIVTSTAEPTVVESTAAPAEVTAESTAEPSQVIDQVTPMDSNVTYNNINTVEPTSQDPLQHLVDAAVFKQYNTNANENASAAMSNFLNNDYNYDKNEAGTYWVAGAINDNNTQMSFLQTLINEEMYDEMDLQKYYYDTQLATARAYAAQKNHEVAYGFYRAAQQRALAEGQLTGWYMPAEGRYLLGQYSVAKNVLEKADATPEEITKANNVIKTAETWFSANQISTKGIKCLAMMNYEENVRYNTVMGNLKKQANDIARAQVQAASAGSDIQLREYKFNLEEYELATGHNITKEIGLDNSSRIGHDFDDYKNYGSLRGYDSVQEMLKRDATAYQSILTTTTSQWIKNLMGSDEEYQQAYENYKADVINTQAKIAIENDGYLESKYLTKKGKIEDTSKLKNIGTDKNIYTITTREGGKLETRAYYKDKNGAFKQIKDESIKLSDGKTLKDSVTNFSTSTYKYNGDEVQIGSVSKSSIQANQNKYKNLTGSQKESVLKLEKEGYEIVDGYYSTQGIDASIVMKDEDGNYYEVSDMFGKVKEIYEKDLKKKDFDREFVTEMAPESKLFTEIGKAKNYKNSYDYEIEEGGVFTAKDADGNNHYYIYDSQVYSKGIHSPKTTSYRQISEEEAYKYMGKEVPNKTKEDTTTESTTKKTTKSGISSSSTNISGGSAQFQAHEYTPEEIIAVYNKVDIPVSEIPEIPDTINDLKELQEYLERYKDMEKLLGGGK
jgi:hypothetical protein